MSDGYWICSSCWSKYRYESDAEDCCGAEAEKVDDGQLYTDGGRQTIEVIANDAGIVRIDADVEAADFASDQIKISGLDPGESVELTILAGVANPIEGGFV